jgi:hypothetical protein
MKNTDKLEGKGELLYLDDDFGISVELKQGLHFCHCEINQPTTRHVVERCRLKIIELQQEHKDDAYGVSVQNDEKHYKFLNSMGFEFLVNKWTLDEQGNDAFIAIFIRRYKND